MIKIKRLLEELRAAGLEIADIRRLAATREGGTVTSVATQHVRAADAVELVWHAEPALAELAAAEQVIQRHDAGSDADRRHSRSRLSALVQSDEESAQLLRVFARLLLTSLRPVYQQLGLPIRSLKDLQQLLGQLAENGGGEND